MKNLKFDDIVYVDGCLVIFKFGWYYIFFWYCEINDCYKF